MENNNGIFGFNNPNQNQKPLNFVEVDSWKPKEEDEVFKAIKGEIFLDVSSFYGFDTSTPLDRFSVKEKRSYGNNLDFEKHLVHYLNYFIKFYDTDKELQMIYYRLKYLMDYETESYTYQNFMYDISRYIMSPSMMRKIDDMNRHNYKLELSYINDKNPSLQYNNEHGLILMKMSLIMNMVIPLSVHFIHVNMIANVNEFLLGIYDMIFKAFDVDIYSKLYETAKSNVERNRNNNETLWNMQSIRGKDVTTHSLYSVENIVLNIMPKYCYNENIIHFNYRSIINNTKFQITDIGYEYNFVSLSSSNRDDEANSDFDRYEAFLTKSDESLYIQNKVSAESTMNDINLLFGPFNQAEIDFYSKALSENGKIVINTFQKDLVFNLFYKYFGDPVSIKGINKDDYIKLIITSKRMLQSNNMVILPYIVSSKIVRLITRKNLNKKELTKLESSPYYSKIIDKYRNEKIEKHILSIIATILSSEFQIIDFYDDELNGKIIDIIPDIVCEEILMYITMI